MRKMMKNKKGFTLIELVMVIVILGILAAVAIPRYVDMSAQAQLASANGIAGGLRAANAIITADRAVSRSTASWDWTTIVGSANISGVTIATATNTILFTIGNSTFVMTLNPTTPSVGAPATMTQSW